MRVCSLLLSLLLLSLVTPARAETGQARSFCSSDPFGLLQSCTFRESYEDQPPPRPRRLSREEAQARAQEDQAWRAYCRPRIEQDRLGVNRYTYANPGCEFGRVSPSARSRR